MARSSFSDQDRSDFLSSGPRASKSRNTNKRKRRPRISDRRRGAVPWARPLVYTFAVIAGMALVVVGIVLAISARNDDVDPAHKVLELTAQDIDPETTAAEKNLLKMDQIDSRLAAALSRDARRQLSGSALQEGQRALADGHVNPAVAPLVKQLAAEFAAGKAAAFTIWVAEDESQAGNAVNLQLDGVPLGKFSIEQNRYAITLVGRMGQSLRLQITGASEANRTAVFRAETATSNAETRHLQAGRNDEWQLVVR
jgi:hypothetical protein